MRCRLKNPAAKFGVLVFQNGCENADNLAALHARTGLLACDGESTHGDEK